MKLTIPRHVENLLATLNSAGFSAYVVGGCVRDALLGKEPADWDVCTSAKPEEIKSCFGEEKTVDTGIRHGTVGVITDGGMVEVTTYRVDGDYEDGRHPSFVAFTSCMEEDLARRDFTVNAMAFHPERGLVDPFDGQADLHKRRLRCVGDGEARLAEDGLRIMRGLRFASVLEFTIDAQTLCAMKRKASCIGRVSAERISGELSKLLLGDGVDQVMAQYGELLREMIAGLHPRPVAALPQDLVVRLAAIFPAETKKHLTALRYSGAVIREATAVARLLQGKPPQTRTEIKALLHREGLEPVRRYLGALGKASSLAEILNAGDCWTLQDLAVCGRDLLDMGVAPGRQVGRILEQLLRLVIEENLDNQRKILLNYVQKQMMDRRTKP